MRLGLLESVTQLNSHALDLRSPFLCFEESAIEPQIPRLSVSVFTWLG